MPDMEAIIPKNVHIGQINFGLAGGGLIEQPQRRSRIIENKAKIYVLASMKVSDNNGELLAEAHGAAISDKNISLSFKNSERIIAVRVDTDGFDSVLALHFLIWDENN